MKAKLVTPVIAAITLFFGATAMADVGHGKEDIGQPGVASAVTRTVDVEMGDIFFMPKNIDVKPGETIRFVLRNKGALLHEFNIGCCRSCGAPKRNGEHVPEWNAYTHRVRENDGQHGSQHGRDEDGWNGTQRPEQHADRARSNKGIDLDLQQYNWTSICLQRARSLPVWDGRSI